MSLTPDQIGDVFAAIERRHKIEAAAAVRRLAPLRKAAVVAVAASIAGKSDDLGAADALVNALIVERRRASAIGYSAALEKALESLHENNTI